ncbi:MAG: tRNA 2-thiouridine(34) synthase MnmA, partial [Clostridia bacterium]|nr:tRNA 2-thiouridine(34) synthase MnmA [Clostridia bacterium]
SYGRTPNPCIMCNKNIKFGYLYGLAMENGFDYLATGHYATINQVSDRYYLEKASDETRDQTYFLYVLMESQLDKILFPLNGIPKEKAREICNTEGLMPRNSGESREICFVPDDYRNYLESDLNIKVKNGNFITKTGKIIGTHEGIHRYTLGQRKGLGITVGKPVFITHIDENTGDIILGDEEDLFTKEIIVKNVNLINGTLPNNERFYVKIRYGSMNYEAAELKLMGTDSIMIKLQEPARAVTPGQSAVIYCGSRVIGGGTIK